MLELKQYKIKLLSSLVFEVELKTGTIVHEIESLPTRGIYFVISGNVQSKSHGEIKMNKVGDVFGIETVFSAKELINAEIIADCKLCVLKLDDIKSNISLPADDPANAFFRKIPEKINMNDRLDFSKLRTHQVVGKGVFGKVWLTTFSNDDDKINAYALKEVKKKHVIKKKCVTMILREARILLKINHQFIIDLLNVYQNESSLLMLFPLMSGGELYGLMEEYTCFSEKASRFYLGTILEALSYLHENNVLFRDLKPENVLIDDDGYCILVDFGFGKRFLLMFFYNFSIPN